MDENWVLRMPWAGKAVSNGLGGYASGTVGGASTRRYHGLLIAALPAPLGRQMMLNHLSELLRLPDGSTVLFGSEERVGDPLVLHGTDHLTEFRLESGLPVWHYEVGGDDTRGARRFLEGLVRHLGEACIGSISEIFDAEGDCTPRGCVAQAWSVAEVLRSWVRTAGDKADEPIASRPELAVVSPI